MAAMEAGIYDAQGRWLAPLAGNEELPAPPPRVCPHGTLCAACGKSYKSPRGQKETRQ